MCLADQDISIMVLQGRVEHKTTYRRKIHIVHGPRLKYLFICQVNKVFIDWGICKNMSEYKLRMAQKCTGITHLNHFYFSNQTS